MSPFSIERHVAADDLTKALHADVREGLTGVPKTLPPKWFYDARGSELFERITALDEYYPTRAERAILMTRAAEVAAASRAQTLVELGSGSSEKTRLLLDALGDEGSLRRYIPLDVSESALTEAAERIAAAHPSVEVHGVVADFEHSLGALSALPRSGPRLVALLGGTIGNLLSHERVSFFARLRGELAPGDALLVGTDLVKERERLVPAYDDAHGVTAAFNRNVLHVINRELGGNFAPEQFEHVAVWDGTSECIEMRLRSLRHQMVRIPALDLSVEFAAGEELRTEVSAKFRRTRVEAELARAGLALRHWWTDDSGDFAVWLAAPAG